MRSVSSGILSNLLLDATRPVALVRIEHSGLLELLSETGTIIFDGEVYTAGGITVDSVADGESATLSMPVTSDRISEIQGSTWVNGVCQIYFVPGTTDDTAEYTAAQGVLSLDGMIASSSFSGNKISIKAVHRSLGKNYTPRNIISEVCNHIPPPGSI